MTRLRKSGPVSQTLDLILNLDKNLYHPIVIALYAEDDNNTMLKEYTEAGADYFCLNIGRLESLAKGGKLVADFMEEIKPDIIHSVGMPLYKMAICYKGCPNFTTIHNYVFEDYPVKYGKVLGNLMALQDIAIIKRNADHMVTCSKSLSLMYFNKKGISVDYIRNGVDTSRYQVASVVQKEKKRERLDLPLNKIIAVFTGQVCSRKNQAFAVEGIVENNRDDLCIVLLGDGPELKTLKEKYANCKKVVFRGQVSNVAEYLQAADFYVSSSTSEGLPIGVLEAMSAGLPQLLSDIIQHKEIIEFDDNLGIVFENNNLQSFNLALNELLKRNLNEMGQKCHQIASTKLSAEYMAKKYEDKYEKLILAEDK